MQLIDVYTTDCDRILYDILAERRPEESISHKEMPAWDDHVKFVHSMPYRNWYLISEDSNIPIGTIYLTVAREVGVFVIAEHRGHGYARRAVEMLLDLHPGRILANVNPSNYISRKLWEGMDGELIQVTYSVG